MEALMIGVSGMRGTIGGTLTPIVVNRMASAFAAWLIANEKPANGTHFRVVIGRDGRPSGFWVRDATVAALTASHNPILWNGLKFLNRNCIAPPPAHAKQIRELYDAEASRYVRVEHLVPPRKNGDTHALHVKKVMDYVDVLGISSKRFKVVLDSVNGSGSVATSTLLSRLGTRLVHIHGTPDGQFPHNPEPTAENLVGLADEVKRQKADVGFAQDPDADRLAIVDENGVYIGEEYSLALAARHLMSKKPGGIAATNLSTSRMLDDVAAQFGGRVIRTPVGEANVVEMMQAVNAAIGGEGSAGGVIFPAVQLCRDSFIAMAFLLDLMAETGQTVSELVDSLPKYTRKMGKVGFTHGRLGGLMQTLEEGFPEATADRTDGLKLQ